MVLFQIGFLTITFFDLIDIVIVTWFFFQDLYLF